MRADRLVSILLLLQSRGRVSAPWLADELEVSVRTIHRDMEALGNAGVPIYAIRGPEGGYELWRGFRTELTGISADEAMALSLIGRRSVAQAFGLGDAVDRVDRKVAESLHPHAQAERAQLASWLLIDDPPIEPAVAQLAGYLWTSIERRRETEILVAGRVYVTHPLGLVVRGAAWHLVAISGGATETWPLVEIDRAATTGRRFVRPSDVDLADAWAAAQPPD